MQEKENFGGHVMSFGRLRSWVGKVSEKQSVVFDGKRAGGGQVCDIVSDVLR